MVFDFVFSTKSRVLYWQQRMVCTKMASNIVQLEKFESGDFEEFIDSFDICSLAKEWSEDKKVLMVATCVRGKPQTYKSLTMDERKDYGMVKGNY